MAELIHEITAPVGARVLFDLVGDVESAPRYFPTHLHAEILDTDGERDLVERWVIDDGKVRSWQFWRQRGDGPLRIVFEHHEPRPPLSRMRGDWTFLPQGDATLMRVSHSFELVSGDPADAKRMAEGLDRKIPHQLADLSRLGQSLGELRERTVTDTRTALVRGSRDDVYRRVLAGETNDAGAWARALVPPRKVVFKRLGTMPGVHSLTGDFVISETADGVRVTARQTVTTAPGAEPYSAVRLASELTSALAELED
ncbi:SRPBCC family protein [Actinoplanes sp. NPDC004185]